MHGVKDYWDMVRILDDYPHIRQTFNFAPSLLEQIGDYLNGKATDTAYLLSSKDPALFSESDKLKALRIFFLANEERMINRYRRYTELFMKRGRIGSDKDLYVVKERFTIQDYRDLQVWWNLAWVGEYSRFDPPFKYFLDKQRDFSEEEKHRLLSAHLDILVKIIPHHIEAMKRKQIEIAVSPFYHPILPLLCDSRIATDANPRAALPGSTFRHPEDAERQIKSALDFGREIFGNRPSGMWPSEGSVSDAALKLFAGQNVSWVATDEAILYKSLAKSGRKPNHDFIERYFPYNFAGGTRPVKMFFRDHNLSDKIGFVYSRLTPDEAAHNFVSEVLNIRNSILGTAGEKGLKDAVVSIVLDGENAWEFYQSDGKDFLRTLYYLLENEPRIETVLPSETHVNKENSLRHVEPGSWIDGNFDIWIGHPEDNRAWDFLSSARKDFDEHSAGMSVRYRSEALKEIMICEGSDWCWWYGDEHKSAQAAEFDKLFRHHLKQIYSFMGLTSPPALDEPIKRRAEQLSYGEPVRMISPKIVKTIASEDWAGAGWVEQEQQTGAMQQTGQRIKRVRFGNDRSSLYLMIETAQRISTETITIELFSPVRMWLEIGEGIVVKTDSKKEEERLSVHYVKGDAAIVRIGIASPKSGEALFSVSISEGAKRIDTLPRQGTGRFKLLQ